MCEKARGDSERRNAPQRGPFREPGRATGRGMGLPASILPAGWLGFWRARVRCAATSTILSRAPFEKRLLDFEERLLDCITRQLDQRLVLRAMAAELFYVGGIWVTLLLHGSQDTQSGVRNCAP